MARAGRQIARAATALMLLAVLAAAVGLRPLAAFEIEFSGRVVKRDILALYDSRTEGAPHLTRLHKLAEMPLNHLGYRLVYQDVNTALPEMSVVARHRAVLSWFVEPLAQPEAYVAWLERALDQNLAYVMLGEIAPREPDELLPAVNRIMARLGLQHSGTFIDLTFRAKPTTVDAAMIGFEQKLDKVVPGFPVVNLLPGQTKVHLEMEVPTAQGQRRSVVVATSPRGGFAAQNFTVSLEPNTDRLAWQINPFLFFKLALGDERFPVPDVTTVSGRRLYFSQIDGDGWNNLTEVEGYRERQTLSAEVVAREAIENYPDLPVSVGLIAGDTLPLLGGNPDAARAARRLFAQPQVEVASHTYSHPYTWSFFETYRREEEERLVRTYRPPAQPLRERLGDLLLEAAGREVRSARYDPYVAGTDDLPRTYLREPFDLDREVAGALKVAEALAPTGKTAKLYQWSGDTTPFEAAVRATRLAGVRNINGGDSRLDREYPSVAYVPAIARPVGRERQIYAVNSNENTYTNEWTGPFGGQLMLEHTLRNTNSPRRLKGFNLYYHMYSGEKPAALAAVRYFLDLARNSDVAPIAASDYAAIADGFFATEIQQVDLFAWAVTNRGGLQTVRFDDAEALAVDLAKSTGVIGFTHTGTTLYVTLDGAVERAIVSLRARASEAAAAAPGEPGAEPAEPVLALRDARWRLSHVERETCGIKFVAQGFGRGDMVWRTRRQRAFKMTVARAGQTLLEEVRFADADGLVRLQIALGAIDPVDVRLACHE